MPYKLLFQKAYDLVKWVYPTINRFPRKQRLVLSQRIEVTTIRILELIIDLSQRDTATNKRKILYELHKLQIFFRLCKDLSYLSFRKYEYVSSLLSEIGGGGRKFWRKNKEGVTKIYTLNCAHSETLSLRSRKPRKTKGTRKQFRILSSILKKISCNSNTSLKISHILQNP